MSLIDAVPLSFGPPHDAITPCPNRASFSRWSSMYSSSSSAIDASNTMSCISCSPASSSSISARVGESPIHVSRGPVRSFLRVASKISSYSQ